MVFRWHEMAFNGHEIVLRYMEYNLMASQKVRNNMFYMLTKFYSVGPKICNHRRIYVHINIGHLTQ